MKKFQILIALFTLSMGAMAQNPEGLFVTGKVIRYIDSDEMILRTSIGAEAATVGEAFRLGSEKSAKVLAYLESLDEVCKVETQHVQLNEMYSYDNGKRIRNGFRANQQIQLRIRDFDKYDEIMERLIELGVDGISNVMFSSTQTEKVRKEVRLEAIGVAREKAEVIAEALGVSVGQVIYFEEIGHRMFDVSTSNEVAYKSGIMVEPDAPVVSPAQTAVEVEVRVRFAILAP